MADDRDHRTRRQAWTAFRRLLAREFPDHADGIRIMLELGHAVIRGEIGSEHAKALIGDHVRRLPGVDRVVNRLVVAAPLKPATSWDPLDDPASEPPFLVTDDLRRTPREGTNIIRHPAIEPGGPAVPGLPLTLSMDLRLLADGETDAEPIAISDLGVDWERVEVDVEVHSASLSFVTGSNRGVVVVRRDDASLPFVLHATVHADVAPDLIEVMAIFTHCGRYAGIVRRSIAVRRLAPGTDAASGVRDGSEPRPAGSPSGTIGEGSGRQVYGAPTLGCLALRLEAEVPTLTLKILRSAEGVESRYVWTSTSPVRGGPANRTGYLSLGDDPARFAQRMRAEVAGLRPGQHEDALRGYGQEIWERTPADFQELYWTLRDNAGPDFPIQIVTDEPHIPWELMQPFDDASGRGGDHLFLDHPVARWIGSAEGHLWQDLPSGRIASFAPVYAESAYELPFAEDEAAWLCAELGAVPCTPKRGPFLDLLREGWRHGPVAAVHFAGHGSFDDAGRNGILMTDGWVSATEVGQSRNVLGNQYRSMAILNACDVGASAHSLGTMSGWASALAKRRYGGLVAPLWPVSDPHASDVIRTMTRSLYRDHATLGQAVRIGRLKGCRHSATPFAYVCYGDVMGRVTDGPGMAPAGTGVP
ncbi:CHAT domain-containing protein [Methylobacterium sp. J-059]|uniref:CHAT domain-containing protein n=1 Tax=Methylobacterium sp. J-059 TaxID=2836643 RepID=UPI001FBAFA56|nr:CHAT domain-containing protein [Methylobacterium sp. J-059]MCJ2041038.1 CHAT domain-containing protein [Methylobacterium sp. J-059]